jgi:hypothetical protein
MARSRRTTKTLGPWYSAKETLHVEGMADRTRYSTLGGNVVEVKAKTRSCSPCSHGTTRDIGPPYPRGRQTRQR